MDSFWSGIQDMLQKGFDNPRDFRGKDNWVEKIEDELVKSGRGSRDDPQCLRDQANEGFERILNLLH